MSYEGDRREVRHSLMTTFEGRLGVVQMLHKPRCYSLSIGSSSTRISDINIDVSVTCRPDVVADAANLPFVTDAFEEVVFTDVIEHLPPGREEKALHEIRRILRKRCRLIVSTPNARAIFTFLDPSHWLSGHRHYSPATIKRLLETTSFQIETEFTSGGTFAMMGVIWYSLITWPFQKLFKSTLPYSPRTLRKRENAEYLSAQNDDGYTLFVVASKI